MDNQDLINVLGGILLAVLGWLSRQLWDAVQELKRDVQKIEIDLPTHYTKKDEMEIRFDKLEAMLERIFSKLDSKQDKT